MIGSGSAIHETQTEITAEDYNRLYALTQNVPVDTFESVYYLDAETETYLPRERTHEEIIEWYMQLVQFGTVKLEDVPEEYRAEVEAQMPVSEEEQWANEIMQEVAEHEY